MFSDGLSGIKAYGPGALAFIIIALLAGVLVERRILTPRPSPAPGSLSAVPLISADETLPGLRRIVLDPCTGLEKTQVTGAVSSQAVKAD